MSKRLEKRIEQLRKTHALIAYNCKCIGKLLFEIQDAQIALDDVVKKSVHKGALNDETTEELLSNLENHMLGSKLSDVEQHLTFIYGSYISKDET